VFLKCLSVLEQCKKESTEAWKSQARVDFQLLVENVQAFYCCIGGKASWMQRDTEQFSTVNNIVMTTLNLFYVGN